MRVYLRGCVSVCVCVCVGSTICGLTFRRGSSRDFAAICGQWAGLAKGTFTQLEVMNIIWRISLHCEMGLCVNKYIAFMCCWFLESILQDARAEYYTNFNVRGGATLYLFFVSSTNGCQYLADCTMIIFRSLFFLFFFFLGCLKLVIIL